MMRFWGKRTAARLFAVGLILWGMLAAVIAHADTATGIAWLTQHAQSSGAYTSPGDLATPVQTTAETLRAFKALGESAPAGLNAARQWLAQQNAPNTEYRARQLIAATDAGQPTGDLVNALLTHQNPADGGFGDAPGDQSTVLDTAFALEALAIVGTQPAAVTEPAVRYLLGQQAADGGWADGANTPSVFLSAVTLRALWHYRAAFNVDATLDQAQAFLLRQRTGDRWATPFETALALIAIAPRLPTLDSLTASINTLTAAQAADSSWASDVYSTALALRALTLARNTVPNPDLATLTGRVVDGDSGLPLRAVAVELQGPLTARSVTGSDGQFQFGGLATGSYTLKLTLADFEQDFFEFGLDSLLKSILSQ